MKVLAAVMLVAITSPALADHYAFGPKATAPRANTNSHGMGRVLSERNDRDLWHLRRSSGRRRHVANVLARFFK